MPHPDNSDYLRGVLANDPGFVGATLAPTLVELSTERVVLDLDAGVQLQQHFGGPHAAIIFGLGETSAYLLLMRTFADLVEGTVAPLVKGGQIGYTAIARGRLRATAVAPEGAEASARAAFAERGSMSFPVDVTFSDEQGATTGSASYTMGLKRF